MALATARAYLAVVAQKRVVEINARALATDRAHYDYTHIRLVGGVGNRVDDVRAAQQVASDEAQLETSYTALARAREALAVLVGEAQPLDVYDDVSLASSSTDPRGSDRPAARRRSSQGSCCGLAEKVKTRELGRLHAESGWSIHPFLPRPGDAHCAGDRVAGPARAELPAGGRRPSQRPVPGARGPGRRGAQSVRGPLAPDPL